MAINLADVADDTAEATVLFRGQKAVVKYRPSTLTVNTLAEADKMTTLAQLVEFIEMVVEDWDIRSGKTKVPVNATGIGKLPASLLRAVVQAVVTSADAAPEA